MVSILFSKLKTATCMIIIFKFSIWELWKSKNSGISYNAIHIFQDNCIKHSMAINYWPQVGTHNNRLMNVAQGNLCPVSASVKRTTSSAKKLTRLAAEKKRVAPPHFSTSPLLKPLTHLKALYPRELRVGAKQYFHVPVRTGSPTAAVSP